MKFFTAKLKSTADFYTQIALILVIVLLLESIFAFLPLRFDATQAKIYSISEVTKKTLKGLDDIVTIKGYFTEELPGYLITVRQNVKDILAEYRNFGGARIKVQFLNPNANDALKSEAQSLGLPAIQFNVVKKDKYEVAQGYLGIAVLYGDRVETIPVVQDTSALEYNLTAAIKKVISGTDFTVGILQKTDSLLSEEQDLQALQQILSRQYRVERIS
jgi:ABC-type uncharacterized transport system involved in gliding motility auxiliary subunit